ncbi:uncharacterized protein [Dendropsophus ebraccatus]|uniref:uncharacterized protein n=1 Tax=Dendropsophus ebraccatus TaxID=150705 RepID=UPI0038310C01
MDLRMDSNSGASLAFLYKNDPFYSLCLSDLMTARQYVTNQFLKEQRSLTESLRRIDHCQLSRMAQLNEEKKQFTLLMKRRLAPRARSLSTPEGGRGSRTSLSTMNFSNLSSITSCTQSLETISTASGYRRDQSGSRSACIPDRYNGRSHIKDSQHFFGTLLPVTRDQHGKTPKLTRSERCFSALHSENIGKTISRTTYRIK